MDMSTPPGVRRWHVFVDASGKPITDPPRAAPPVSSRRPSPSTAAKIEAAEARLRGSKAGAEAYLMDQAEAVAAEAAPPHAPPTRLVLPDLTATRAPVTTEGEVAWRLGMWRDHGLQTSP